MIKKILIFILFLTTLRCTHTEKAREPASISPYSTDKMVSFTDKKQNLVEVYIITNEQSLKQYVNYKRGFCIFELTDRDNQKFYFFAFTKWMDPERSSSHYYIDEAVMQDFKNSGLESRYKMVRIEKGYIQPKNGKWEVYDLGGASAYDYNGFYGSQLSSSAQMIKSLFFRAYHVIVQFAQNPM